MKEIESPKKQPSILYLKATQWSEDFEQKMRARLIMGAIRYGLMGNKNKPKYDRLSSIINKAKIYKESGNTELLADIANCALLEYVEGTHPKKHFKALDDKLHVGVV